MLAIALTSPLRAAQYTVSYADVMGEGHASVEGAAAGKLNLRDARLRKDVSPILAGCKCFACRRHTRGYIHHLINTHEMLAVVLLNMHNHHQYGLFFAAVRESIANGTFDQYSERFLSMRRHG